ncbi:hypothetical protein V1508DRAFT_423070 [Lipomyces doorenjongii]|uniref:uncharacterized protein n=1 Tax=Lipomyces doorenjongii TaxID=383834 RepID=UPI0034CE4F95
MTSHRRSFHMRRPTAINLATTTSPPHHTHAQMSKRASTSATYKRARRRTSPNSSPDPDSRLDESELLEQDIPGAQPKPSRRNRLREVQGYRSDSSEDEFFTTARKARSGGNANGAGNKDDDEDMFAEANGPPNVNGNDADGDGESSDEDDLDGVSKRSKKVRFMELNEIEGQDLSVGENVDTEIVNREVENFAATQQRKEKGKLVDVDDEDEDEDVTEDIDPEIGLKGSRLHVPQLEAFNMRADLEDGQFDANGTFIRRPDADSKTEEMHDGWLDGVSRREIRAAAKADEVRRNRERIADAQRRRDEEERPASALMDALLCELDVTETPMEALQRLGPGKKKKWGNNKRKKQEVETDEEREKERRRKESVETITDAADKLMSRSVPDIYDIPREQIARLYARDTGEEWKERT